MAKMYYEFTNSIWYHTDMEEMVIRIAEAVKKAGGNTYLVGGCVRDVVMGRPVNDLDIEVHGIQRDKLYELLSS